MDCSRNSLGNGDDALQMLQEALEHEYFRAYRYGNIFAVVFVRVCNFAGIVTRYGGEAAALVTSNVGRILGSSTRTCDRSFQYSESEFIVLLPNTTQDRASSAALKLKKRISENPLSLSEGVVVAEMDFGISVFPCGTRGDARGGMGRRGDEEL